MKFRIVCFVVLLSCLTILSCLASLSPSALIPSQGTIRYSSFPRLHTDGGYIKNEYGQIVQLTGVCWMDYNIQRASITGDRPPGYTPVQTILWRLQRHKELGVNCIRISMNQHWWIRGGEYGQTPEGYQQELDAIVQYCQDLHIYVYFCLHLGSSGANDLQAALMADHNHQWIEGGYGWLDFVKLLTARYQNFPSFIGLQIWSEPAWGHETDINVLNEKWAAFMQSNVDAIHSVNADVLVFVTSPGYYTYKSVSDYYLDNPLIGDNIVYTWQDYYKHQSWRNFYQNYEAGNYDLAKQQMEQWFYRTAFKMVNASIAPVIYAETGWNAQLNIDPEEARVINDTADIFAKYQQGWTLWVWWGHDPPASYDLCEDDFYSLSPYGQVAVENLASLPESPIS